VTARKRNAWWAAAVGCAALILVGSVVPVGAKPRVPYLDKAAHLCEYLLFAWLLVQAIRKSRMPEREYRLWAWLYATSYGLLLELLQVMLPWRSGDWGDAGMNAIGAAFGVWVGNRLPRPTPHS
jgi:VanZ family protein